ncbi:AfsR/SARP family transcriptional regulator [Kutzneria viridogrisea]
MFVGMLGAFEVRLTCGTVTPSAPKPRTVLALLALNAGSVVHLDQLVEELWEHRPPGSPSTTLQTYVYQLRKLLTPGSRGGTALQTKPRGYQLLLGENAQVDVRSFEALLTRGRKSLDAGAHLEAAGLLREALGLWRGPAFGGIVQGPVLSAYATHLEESRKSAMELCFEADLALGRHRHVVDELSGVVRSHPTHEGFSAKLMTALYRCGRKVEALEVFRRLRAEFVDQLGLEPSAALHDLHQRVLTDDHSLSPASEPETAVEAAQVPRIVTAPPQNGSTLAQIPPASFHFVGRQAELGLLVGLFGPAEAERRPGLRMAEVTGPPGVGKSTLAVTVAHQVRQSYPDGQVFVDLTPVNNGTATLAQVLTGAMRAAAVPLPEGESDPAALAYAFRGWSADRRVLVVVDDVMSTEQVHCLHPSGPGSGLLVASRRRLHSPGATAVVDLAPLPVAEGVHMLAAIIGEQRVAAELDSAVELVHACRGLPLAIRAVGGRLAYRTRWTLAGMVFRLSEHPDWPLRVSAGAVPLRETLLGNYTSLPEAARGAFRTIVERGADEVTAQWLAGALCLDPVDAEQLLEALADSFLLEEVVDTGHRYRLPAMARLLREADIPLTRQTEYMDLPRQCTASPA